MVICRYEVKPDREDEFVPLLKEHWPTLRRLDLATDFVPLRLRGQGSVLVEIFEWKDKEAVKIAHEHPDVAAIWERMEGLVEKWEFSHYARLA